MPRNSARRTLELKRDIALKRIDECLAAGQEANIDERRLPIFLSRFSKLESHCTSFESHHFKLCSEIAEPTELEAEDEIRQEFDNKYFKIIELHSQLSSKKSDSGESQSDCTGLSVKLPRLNLVNFEGDIKTWATFYDMYNKMVHLNRKLSNIERFSILISLLSGEPLQLLKGFPLSENNYLDAYAALIDRYQCKRKIAFRHWEEIQRVQLNSSSPHELRRLIDTFKENISVLKNLNLPVKDWDFPLFYLLFNKLDQDTRRRFELQNDDTDIPSYESLLKYLDKAGKALEFAEPGDATASPHTSRARAAPTYRPRTAHPATYRSAPELASTAHARALIAYNSQTSDITCVLCNSDHILSRCPTYRNNTPYDRFTIVKENNLCVNCLRPGHVVKSCPSKSRCFKCNVPHHTTIHFDNSTSRDIVADHRSSGGNVSSASLFASDARGPSQPTSSLTIDPQQPTVTLVAGLAPATSLLATASVEVLDNFSNPRKIRIVIDSGSQSNFITKKCAHRLGLPLRKANATVEGIGQFSSLATSSVVYRMLGIDPPGDAEVEALVIPNICSAMPASRIDVTQWSHLNTIQLADPNFDSPGPIDALVGVDIFCKIFLGERLDCEPNGPTAFNTRLGWVIMGKLPNKPSLASSSLLSSLELLETQVSKFWEVEELPKSSALSENELLCENIFTTTHTRDQNGRYIVRLPFKTPNPVFGDSHSLAHRRLLSLEKRLSRDAKLRADYNAFMKDYIETKHMELAVQPRTDHTYYIPHHCVLKPSSTSTKLRVVFDATAKPTGGDALNEQLLVGPKLQSDIGSILLRFRLHTVVFTADIKQMYRQILISNLDREYQRILFRFSPDEPIKEYRLNTVTYGMTSSSYLALRTILQVAEDEGKDRPGASAALSQDVYVDDVVTGADTLEAARELQLQVVEILQSGCFELRKWSSNSSALLENVPADHRYDSNMTFDSESSSHVKVLGMEWIPIKDVFSFAATALHDKCTKRNVLSEIARIFDPIGFLTPLTMAFKCIVQRLWSLGLNWDETVPHQLAQIWFRYRENLCLLSSLEIPRLVPASNSKRVEIHGFCDASELGYAAVVYFRVLHNDDQVTTHLILSRSKVASLAKVSVPRLELCAAVLLSDLIEHVKCVFVDRLQFDDVYCWSDSTVTLSWLKSPSSRWKTYVSNRVSHIQERVHPSHWRHVRSQCNPADCASRGLSADELVNHLLWWSGPEWLSADPKDWPNSPESTEDSPPAALSEQRQAETSLFITVDQFEGFMERHSDLNKVQRIIAYVHRFVDNCRHRNNRKTGPLIASELKDALCTLVKLTQRSAFPKEIESLQRHSSLPKSWRKLHPFIDENGLVRVGGRHRTLRP